MEFEWNVYVYDVRWLDNIKNDGFEKSRMIYIFNVSRHSHSLHW